MGVTDEHWCNICKRPLDKAKDKYAEFEMVNIKKIGKKKFKKLRGLICKECMDKDPKLKEAMVLISKAGNPPFLPIVECLAYKNCSTYTPAVGKPVRCENVAVIDDKVYCKRSHPGSLELPQEVAELERRETEMKLKLIGDMFETFKGKIPETMASDIKKRLENMWIPPSSVVDGKEICEKCGKEKLKTIVDDLFPIAGITGMPITQTQIDYCKCGSGQSA